MSFVTSDKEKYEDPRAYTDRKYLQVLAQRVTDDGVSQGASDEELKELPDELAERVVHITNIKTHERKTATDTYMLAVNENFKEYGDINEYYDGNFSSNAEYKHKAEVHIQSDEWHRKFYFTWRGNMSLKRFMEDIESEFTDALDDDKLKDQGLVWCQVDDEEQSSVDVNLDMWTKNGQFVNVEMELTDLLNCIVGIRVVEFSETIKETD